MAEDAKVITLQDTGSVSYPQWKIDGTTIDAITFGAQTSDVTQGRYPDGTVNIYSMTSPTPGTANFPPNIPNTSPSRPDRVSVLMPARSRRRTISLSHVPGPI